MIRVRRANAQAMLKPATRAALGKRGQASAGFAAGDKRIGTSWANFLRSPAKDDVAKALDHCFRYKCAYCEAVAAKDIEHFYPKTNYPSRMFDWENFLRGCKNCNNLKRDQFPLDQGRPVLLDPCVDDPSEYFVWDLLTGATCVRPEPLFVQRGTATRDLFQLDQEPLREERRVKLRLVTFLLARVVAEEPVTKETRQRLQDELAAHRPWLAVVRQLFRKPGPKYHSLVRRARAKLPDIDHWTAGWL